MYTRGAPTPISAAFTDIVIASTGMDLSQPSRTFQQQLRTWLAESSNP